MKKRRTKSAFGELKQRIRKKLLAETRIAEEEIRRVRSRLKGSLDDQLRFAEEDERRADLRREESIVLRTEFEEMLASLRAALGVEEEVLKTKSLGVSRRGFASMDPETRRAIASLGGRAAHAAGTAHEFSKEEAAVAGAVGGWKRAAAYGSRKKRSVLPSEHHCAVCGETGHNRRFHEVNESVEKTHVEASVDESPATPMTKEDHHDQDCLPLRT